MLGLPYFYLDTVASLHALHTASERFRDTFKIAETEGQQKGERSLSQRNNIH